MEQNKGCYECKHNCSQLDWNENDKFIHKQWCADGKDSTHSEWWSINGKKKDTTDLTSTPCCELTDFGKKLKYFHDKLSEINYKIK